jgi:hypothetical protein
MLKKIVSFHKGGGGFIRALRALTPPHFPRIIEKMQKIVPIPKIKCYLCLDNAFRQNITLGFFCIPRLFPAKFARIYSIYYLCRNNGLQLYSYSFTYKTNNLQSSRINKPISSRVVCRVGVDTPEIPM